MTELTSGVSIKSGLSVYPPTIAVAVNAIMAITIKLVAVNFIFVFVIGVYLRFEFIMNEINE